MKALTGRYLWEVPLGAGLIVFLTVVCPQLVVRFVLELIWRLVAWPWLSKGLLLLTLGLRLVQAVVQVAVLRLLKSTPLRFAASSFWLSRYPDMAIELEEAILRSRGARKGLLLNCEIFRLRFDVSITVLTLEVQNALKRISS